MKNTIEVFKSRFGQAEESANLKIRNVKLLSPRNRKEKNEEK